MKCFKFLGSVCVASCLLFVNVACGMDRGKENGTGAKNSISSLRDRFERLPAKPRNPRNPRDPRNLSYYHASLLALLGFDEETQMCNANSTVSSVKEVSEEKLQRILEILKENRNKITIDTARNCNFHEEEEFLCLAGLLYKKGDELKMDDDSKAKFLENFFENNTLVCSVGYGYIGCIPGF